MSTSGKYIEKARQIWVRRWEGTDPIQNIADGLQAAAEEARTEERDALQSAVLAEADELSTAVTRQIAVNTFENACDAVDKARGKK